MRLILTILIVASGFACEQGRPLPDERLFAVGGDLVNAASPTPSKTRTRKFDEIEKRSKQYGIEVLRTKNLGECIWEMRIWSSVDLESEKVFVIRRCDDRTEAKFIQPKLHYGEDFDTDRDHIDISLENIHVSLEREKKLELLKERFGISPPLPYGYEPENSPAVLDEGVVSIEVRDDRGYDVIGYRAYTETNDGLEVLRFCQEIEAVFQVRIGCKH